MNDKTEQPTPKKLRDARKKGQVPKSKEVSSAALIIVVLVMLFVLMPSFVTRVQDMILAPAGFYEADFDLAADTLIKSTLISALMVFSPIVIAVVVVGAMSNIFQFGLMFNASSIQPKLSNLNPASGFKKIFALKNLVEFIKSAFKIAFLALLIFLVLRNAIHELVKIPNCGINCVLPVLANIFRHVIINTIAAFVVVAAADYVFQKWQFMRDQRMSKDEVKREYKESEGDPHVKGKRKQFAKELVQSSEDAGVRKSKVVVTNPTHIAVALDYREDETPLPVIRAIGTELRAKRIIQIAQEEGIPIMENVPLARGLYGSGEVDQYIPVELLQDVAEVLAWVEELAEQQRPPE